MKKRLISLAQLAIGIGLIALLCLGVDKGYQLVEFDADSTDAAPDSVYRNAAVEGQSFIVQAAAPGIAALPALATSLKADHLAPTGMLERVSGRGPDRIAWTDRHIRDYGLTLLGRSFRRAASHWGFLLAAMLSSFLCLTACTLRWRVLLGAQGMRFPFHKVFSLYFIGHFFNVLMPGAVGGDLIKVYYVAKVAPHKRTEAVTTVFIDRVVGLLALVLLCAVIMLVRLPFFLRYRETQAALAFNGVLLMGAIAVLVLAFRRNVFERWAFFRKLEARTSLGAVISRIYTAFRLCLNHPGVLFRSMTLSLTNHVVLVVAAYFIGLALEVKLPFSDYLTVFPIINAVAAIPITPGGLGTREVATKFLLGTVGVSQVIAVPLSLLLYASLMGWSILGGIIYVVYAHKLGPIPADDDIAVEPHRGS